MNDSRTITFTISPEHVYTGFTVSRALDGGNGWAMGISFPTRENAVTAALCVADMAGYPDDHVRIVHVGQ